MLPFLHVCPDYRTSKISGMLLAPLIVGGWEYHVFERQAALLLPEPGFIMAESGQQTPARPLQTAETEAQHVRVLRNYRRP